MCSGFEPLLLEAGGEAIMGDMFLGDMLATGAGEGLAGLGAAEAAGAAGGGAFLGDMAATGAGGGLTAGGLGTAGMAGLGSGMGYLESLGGLDTLAGSQFAEAFAPYASSAADVASITGNAVPGLENNIGTFDGIPAGGDMTPQALPETLGSSGASNFPPVTEGPLTTRSLPLSAAPETQQVLNNAVTSSAGSSAPLDYSGVQDMMPAFNSGPAMPGVESPFSLANMASKAYDFAKEKPIPTIYGAASLYDMYAKNKMAKAQEGMYNQNRADINNMYAPGSPEYNLLQQQMARADAKAGRNSQYGTRANELAGAIAKYKTNALTGMQSGQNSLANLGLGNRYGMMNTPATLATLYAMSK